QLCDLLTAIHKQGIIHRDLKPGNLMIFPPDLPRPTLKVMDFGLAKLSTALYIAPEDITDPNRRLLSGTPQYVCPELIRGEEIDHGSDFYSVGVLLFEMLSGRRPFEAKEVKGLLAAHENDLPPAFSELGVSAPAAIENLVQACLCKLPSGRPSTAAELG